VSYNPDDLTLALDLSSDHIKSVSYTSPSTRTVLVLAAAATYITGAFSHLPRLFITGAYGTGKSTLLSAVQPLVANPVRNSGQLSTTFAYRNDFRAAVQDGVVPTSMCDETRHVFKDNGKGGGNHPLYTIGTEGYSKSGAPVRYQEKDMNVSYSCYQVMILASRSNQALPEDILERSIVMELARKPAGMKLGSVEDPTFLDNGGQCGLFLRSAIQAAVEQVKLTARNTDWYEKSGLDNRTADIWVSLFAIAEVAGGAWPSMVSAAYAELGAKNCRNLPTRFQIQVDVLSYIHMTGADQDKLPAREVIDYLAELGRKCYTWDGTPFTLRKFGIELKNAGVECRAVHGKRYYRVSDAWMKQADHLANPVTIEAADPENDWELFEKEFFEGTDN
jgi:hypothetical protein